MTEWFHLVGVKRDGRILSFRDLKYIVSSYPSTTFHLSSDTGEISGPLNSLLFPQSRGGMIEGVQIMSRDVFGGRDLVVIRVCRFETLLGQGVSVSCPLPSHQIVLSRKQSWVRRGRFGSFDGRREGSEALVRRTKPRGGSPTSVRTRLSIRKYRTDRLRPPWS